MSQADPFSDLHNDSSLHGGDPLHVESPGEPTDGKLPQAPTPVPPPPRNQPVSSSVPPMAPPTVGSAPGVIPPPNAPSSAKSSSAKPVVPNPPAKRGSVSPLPAVPPPPPPRSTLPPVQPAPAPQAEPPSVVPTGVGSAKGLRWRGQLAGVGSSGSVKQAKQQDRPEDTSEAETRTQDRVSRSAPPWLVSMVMHLVLLLVLALITTPAGSKLGSVVLSIGQSKESEVVSLAEFEIDTNDVIEDAESLEESVVDVDVDTVFDTTELSNVEDLVPVDLGVGSDAPLARPMFSGRSGAMKDALLAIYGGTAETQEAVKLGLEWLKRNQRKNGSWSMRGPYRDGGFTENDVAATAMAMLAFLGDGHTHKSGEYKDVVERAIKYLVSKQDRSGFFARGARSHEQMYAQGQATIAICELYGITKDSWLRPRAQLAVDFAEDAQSPEGGWRYQVRMDSDTSVTGWYVMALESARSAGLTVHESKLRAVEDFLDTVSSYEDAAYSYQPQSSPTAAMTAEGLLCRQYLGWPQTHPPLRRGVYALLETPVSMSDRDVYYWYYATQVIHHFGGNEWHQWNNVMRVELPRAQVKSGREAGSWSPQMDRWGQNSGRLYTTCLSIYCLEVYYRHLPLYKNELN